MARIRSSSRPDAAYDVSADLPGFTAVDRELTFGAVPCDRALDLQLTLKSKSQAAESTAETPRNSGGRGRGGANQAAGGRGAVQGFETLNVQPDAGATAILDVSPIESADAGALLPAGFSLQDAQSDVDCHRRRAQRRQSRSRPHERSLSGDQSRDSSIRPPDSLRRALGPLAIRASVRLEDRSAEAADRGAVDLVPAGREDQAVADSGPADAADSSSADAARARRVLIKVRPPTPSAVRHSTLRRINCGRMFRLHSQRSRRTLLAARLVAR